MKNIRSTLTLILASLTLPLLLSCASAGAPAAKTGASPKTRVIVNSDGEIDDECSMVRFLLYANEWDIEGIITTSSQYHWQGHKWAGDDWVQPYLAAYAKVYPNLIKHDSRYPTPEYLQARTFLGNVKAEGEMDEITPGSQHIVNVLLDESDDRPVWIQAWGGINTIARALKTIEEEHPEKMAYVANKIRFFFIWEQDKTYQDYIRPHWGKYNILTIISDQFWAMAYQWDQALPEDKQKYFTGAWMKDHLLENHGPLCALYKAKENGDFRSEGDSPAFLHTIVTGLRSMESPGLGWLGRALCAGAREHVARSGAGGRVRVSGGAMVYEFGVGAGQLEEGDDVNRGAAPGIFQADLAVDGCGAKRFCVAGRLVRKALCESQPSAGGCAGPCMENESPAWRHRTTECAGDERSGRE